MKPGGAVAGGRSPERGAVQLDWQLLLHQAADTACKVARQRALAPEALPHHSLVAGLLLCPGHLQWRQANRHALGTGRLGCKLLQHQPLR